MTSRQLLAFLLAATLPSLLICLFVTAFVRRWAARWSLIDKPTARKVHATPTPLGGGIAIWLGVVLPLVAGLIAAALIMHKLLPADIVPEFATPHLGGVLAQSGKLIGLLVASGALMAAGAGRRLAAASTWHFRLGVQALVAGLACGSIDDLRLTVFLDLPLVTGAALRAVDRGPH